jgi:starvation-inducible outer membrane lipoprotein
MKNIRSGTLAAVVLCAMLSACATTGTRVSGASDTYKAMARTQQAWCSNVGCGCTLDGQPATCTLVATCLNMGSCQRTAQ